MLLNVLVRDNRFSKFILAFFAIFAWMLLPAGVSAQGVDDGSERSVPGLRAEKVVIPGGAEIVTIFGDSRFNGISENSKPEEIPLMSVLRDTMGDTIRENDQLRYVWMLTSTNPSFWQRAASVVPLFYFGTAGRKNVGDEPPPIIADIRRTNKNIWGQMLWTAFRQIALSDMGVGIRASGLQFRRNSRDINRSAVASALAILAVYESVEGKKVLAESELRDIQARLWLKDKPFGWHVGDEDLHRVYQKRLAGVRDRRGNNWELLRQYAESNSLYFDPLSMPDGRATHAMLWIDADEAKHARGRNFNGRFLNIKNPWKDDRILNWDGYVEERWFDAESRIVDPHSPGAVPKRLIPLALYGLDGPKIPEILVDFRDARNPKRREVSRRLLNDVANDILTVSRFSNLPYFVGRFVYDYSTGKRGMDINRPSRLRVYAQIKMLLALDASLDPDFRAEISDRLGTTSINPLENGLPDQINVAWDNYRNLMVYAHRPDGLPAKLDRDRRSEMVKFAHNKKERFFLNTAKMLTLGLYHHRESPDPALTAKLNIDRQLDFHERFLRETSALSVDPSIDADLDLLRQSLVFVSEHGDDAGGKTSRALASIFNSSSHLDIRMLCLSALYRIDNSRAKKELLAIYERKELADDLRAATRTYLRRALDEGQKISKRDAAVISGISEAGLMTQ